MDIKYNITELFRAAFGVSSPVFIPSPLYDELNVDLSKKTPNQKFDIKNIKTFEDEYGDFQNKSALGTPIVFAAFMIGGAYRIYDKGQIKLKNFETVGFPPATMFSFRRAKNIIRTNVLGSDGTVKEIFGFDDWIIDVKGLCLDEPNKSARSQLLKLLQYEAVADGIEIEGVLFEAFKINRVCISDFNAEVPQGKPGVIAFSCQLVADQDLELQLSV
jgi:hypothetical protein